MSTNPRREWIERAAKTAASAWQVAPVASTTGRLPEGAIFATIRLDADTLRRRIGDPFAEESE